MSGLSTSIGLISGIDIVGVVDSLISLQREPARILERRAGSFQAQASGFQALEANLASLSTSINDLGRETTFSTSTIANSERSLLRVTPARVAEPGTYKFQSVRVATSQEAISKGFVNSDEQTIGAGTLVIAGGGGLHESTVLDVLNQGNGVRRGSFQITDRSGNSAVIDISDAYTLDDVVSTINLEDGISVTAGIADGRVVLTDTTGSTTLDLSVADLSNGHAAEDLGIAQSVSAATLTGADVFQITGDFSLAQINDGNGLQLLEGAPDIVITLTDDSTLEVNLDGVAAINDVISKINNHEDNAGRVSAAFVNGHLELTDLTGGGGSSAFSVEDAGTSKAVRQLGLDVTAGGTTISGNRLVAGLNSVLIRNLRGGQGIDQIGQLALTDRAGVSTTIDLTGAESLDEIIDAINAAEDGGTKLQLQASVNAIGTGIEIRDTSGATTSNLIIADVGGSTLAAQLGIAIDDSQESVNSGSLNRRYVNEATSLSSYATDGGAVSTGDIRIVDSAGNQAIINIGTAVKTIGDVLSRINSAEDINVRAELNDTGDGIVLIDEAGGGEPPRVEEIDGDTAADLRLLGTGELDLDSKYRITSRQATVIEVTAEDTLDDLVTKINAAGKFVTAAVVDDGSAFSSTRLTLAGTGSGESSRFLIDDGGLDLGITNRVEGTDALLRVGGDVESGFLIASNNGFYRDVGGGLDVQVLVANSKTASVTVSKDTSKIEDAVKKFVSDFNRFVDATADLTKFDPETNARGVLQGNATVFRISSRLDSFVTRSFTNTDSATVKSLIDLGIRIDVGGKLTINDDKLQDKLAEAPQAVADFFLSDETGFADQAETLVNTFTDPFTGTFTLAKNNLQNSVDTIIERILDLDEILEVRRGRLLRQFFRMEEALSALSSQGAALNGISLLNIRPAAK